MPNYRGGDAGMSSFGAEAQKAIAQGNTASQRNRDFFTKAAVTAAKGVLTGMRAIGGKAESDRLKAKQQAEADKSMHTQVNDVADRYARQQYKLAQNALRDSAKQYASPDYTGPEAPETPAWLGDGNMTMEGNKNPYQDGVGFGTPMALSKTVARDALANQEGNESALNNPLDGSYSAQGAQKSMADFAANEDDTNTGLGMMRTGGGWKGGM